MTTPDTSTEEARLLARGIERTSPQAAVIINALAAERDALKARVDKQAKLIRCFESFDIQLAEHAAQLTTARNDALEEAAQAVSTEYLYAMDEQRSRDPIKAIRALKTKE